MIPVCLGPEPLDFDARVRKPGQQFLREERIDFTAVIPRARFKRALAPEQPDYWRRMRPELKAVFKGCCAYSCFLLEEALTPAGVDLTASVDHFQPISQSAAVLAYEWSNLRWSWKTLDNNFKRNKIVPLDPCHLVISPFSLDLGDFGLVVPRAGLATQDQADAKTTINALGLNQLECSARRRTWADDFIRNSHVYSDRQMERWHPFLWKELKRLKVIK